MAGVYKTIILIIYLTNRKTSYGHSRQAGAQTPASDEAGGFPAPTPKMVEAGAREIEDLFGLYGENAAIRIWEAMLGSAPESYRQALAARLGIPQTGQ
ncbi:hypothetical protein GCM10007036_14310 [Alsobacter metallidurans]|uniref:Uncharacterized protein n=1 Tax=Alsobacter metallidurans TaxID=340221 RepID=A0A917MH58_9HYPH|nr:hypothetical protein GCM10007036_14310 [Alsobacter metallidurans]